QLLPDALVRRRIKIIIAAQRGREFGLLLALRLVPHVVGDFAEHGGDFDRGLLQPLQQGTRIGAVAAAAVAVRSDIARRRGISDDCALRLVNACQAAARIERAELADEAALEAVGIWIV